MKRILLLLTAVILCGTLTMNGQARKTANRPSAKARTSSAAKATPKAKAATPATPASDLPKLLAQDDIYGFDPQSTTVTLKNSQITAIYRGFLP